MLFYNAYMLSKSDAIVHMEYHTVYQSFFDLLLAFATWLTLNINTILQITLLKLVFIYIHMYIKN